jgi:Cu(I)/Ag(I) efflux system membrane protein CusA/SilA
MLRATACDPAKVNVIRRGAEVMQRIAVPMIGGMVSSTLLTLVVIPAIYATVKGFRIAR